MKPFKFTAFLLFALLVTNTAFAGPVVVEFFETPSCSAASEEYGHSHAGDENKPPPEKFIKGLPFAIFQNMAVNNPDVIALNCKISYLDEAAAALNPQSKRMDSFCNDRRFGYGKALGFFDRRAFPSMLINAKYETNGEMENVLQSAIDLAKAEKGVHPLEMQLRGDVLDLSLPKLRLERPVDIWVFTYQKIGNVLTDFEQMPEWNGRYYNLSLPMSTMETGGGDYNVAIIIQDPTNAKIIAAGKASKE